MYTIDFATIFHFKFEFFKRETIIIFKIGRENFRPEENEMLNKIKYKAKSDIEKDYKEKCVQHILEMFLKI